MGGNSGGGGNGGRKGGGGSANYGDTVQQSGDTHWYRDSTGKQTVTQKGKVVYQGEGPSAGRAAATAWHANRQRPVSVGSGLPYSEL